ncbi:MAG: DUF362 domain-containing protein [Clostridiales bacterium]|nr:DUF362 domain-containing protein [Clostridiales bacterium]
MASKVYFTDMRVNPGYSLLEKLRDLIRFAGIDAIDFKHKFTAIKMHFGERGNLAFLRPNYAKVVADIVKERGGVPFLTDCNTLYVGGRANALNHMDTANINGFSPVSTGCQILIADGLRGSDELLVPVPRGECVKEARIGRAVMDADVFLSLTHFKGHEMVGFGGAVKNIGMGCGSRAGKMEMHGNGKVAVIKKRCINCALCATQCAHGAHSFDKGYCEVDVNKCVGCGRCLTICSVHAIVSRDDGAIEDLNKKIAEYTYAVLHGRPHFHVSLVIDVSPYCDCHGENDAPFVPNIGMFASFDPVALDSACADAVNAEQPLKNSVLNESAQTHHDHFTDIFPVTDWRTHLTHSETLGIGSTRYELVRFEKR